MSRMAKNPIFIVGCPRSGTTLIRVILDSHPNICCGPETHLIKKLKLLDDKIHSSWSWLESYNVKEQMLNQKIRDILSIFHNNYAKMKNKKRWAEKTPDNIFYLNFIEKLFPDCQFINIIRDGRDVMCSYKQRWGYKSIYSAIKNWNKAIDLSFEYQDKFPKDRYMEIKYEKLVVNPEHEIKKMMRFLGEEWNTDLLEHHKKKHDFWFKKNPKENINLKIEKNPMRHSPSRPIFTSSVGKWKKNLNIFEKLLVNILLDKNLKKLGYK